MAFWCPSASAPDNEHQIRKKIEKKKSPKNIQHRRCSSVLGATNDIQEGLRKKNILKETLNKGIFET